MGRWRAVGRLLGGLIVARHGPRRSVDGLGAIKGAMRTGLDRGGGKRVLLRRRRLGLLVVLVLRRGSRAGRWFDRGGSLGGRTGAVIQHGLEIHTSRRFQLKAKLGLLSGSATRGRGRVECGGRGGGGEPGR